MKQNEILKKIREHAGLIQGDVALALGISRMNYGKKENGKVPFTVDEFFSALDYIKSKAPEAVQKFFPAGYYHTGTSFLNEYKNIEIDDHAAKKSEYDIYNDENVTKIDFEHQELVKGFINKKKGLLANKLLIKLERVNKREFYKWIGDLEGLVEELEWKMNHKPDDPKKSAGG